jgi:hypothetical protein
MEIFDNTMLLISALSKWHGALCHEQNKMNEKDEAEKLEDTSYFFTIMCCVWGIVALDLALVSLSVVSALPTIGFEGPFLFGYLILILNIDLVNYS